MDIGVILGPSVIALLCLPAAYALHAPAWSAGLFAALLIGFASSFDGVIFSLPIAVVVCIYVEKWLFAHALRLQIVAVVLTFLSFFVPGPFPFAVGFALGLFFERSLKESMQLFRAAAITLFVFVVAAHPGFWGWVEGSRALVADYLAAGVAMILFAIGMQIGSGVLKRVRAERQNRLFIVAEREIAGLMDRITPRDSQPA